MSSLFRIKFWSVFLLAFGKTRSYPDLNFELAFVQIVSCRKSLTRVTWTTCVKLDQPLGVTAISATSDTAVFYLLPFLWWCSDNSASNPHQIHCNEFALHCVCVQCIRVVWVGQDQMERSYLPPVPDDMTCHAYRMYKATHGGERKAGKINLNFPVWLSSITLAVGSIITK